MMKLAKGKRTYLMLTGAVVLTLLAGVYFFMAFYYQGHFLPSTKLNGMSVSGKSKEDVEKMITEGIGGYDLTLKTRQEGKEVIKGADISLAPKFGDSILKRLKEQNSFAWPAALFSERELKEPTMVGFDEAKLEKLLEELDCMQKENQKEPEDAHCSEYQPGGYEIVPEERGSAIDQKKLLTVLKDAVKNLKKSVSLEEEGCYKNPEITSDNQELIGLTDTLNRYTKSAVTYDLGEKSETLDGEVTHTWMKIDGMEVSIDEEAVASYVDDLAASYNTVFRRHKLKTASGATVEITNGDHGWKVDKEGEKEQLIKDIKTGESIKREITYAQRAKSHGENDYGDTYVEINLTAQRLYFYKNGSLLVESDLVSGNVSKNYDTPTGIYGLTYKERDAVLRGENYASPVTYWMPFCNNVGMHDASWRSSFGGAIYKTSGSHGCINLPKSAAQKIFENIEEGDPVLVYTLPGTESAEAVAQEAAQVVGMIQAIGEVNFESEPAIAAARKMYDALPPKGQAQVTNYDLLLAAEEQLAGLKAQLAALQPQQ